MIVWTVGIIILVIVLAFVKIEHLSRLLLLFLLLVLIGFLFFSFNKMMKSGEISFDSPRTTINSFVVYGKYLENKTTSIINLAGRGIRFVSDAIK